MEIEADNQGSLFSNFSPLQLLFGGSLVAFLVLGIGIAALKGQFWGSKAKIEVLGTAGSQLPQIATPSGEIIVDVAGAVAQPGVIHLPAGSRVEDALKRTGWFSEEADKERVNRELNLAAPLLDGTKLYIPKINDPASALRSQGAGGQVPQGIGSRVVNLNVASASELESLPGIGPVTAQKIIASRPFKSPADLLDKKIVSKTTFAKIKDSLVVY